MIRLAIVAALIGLMAWGAYALLQRIILAALVVMMLALSACDGVQMPPPWECHKAIAHAVYPRYACVVHEI